MRRDEKNTPRQIRMLINIGGAEPSLGLPSGIHWHMNLANKITYFATDVRAPGDSLGAGQGHAGQGHRLYREGFHAQLRADESGRKTPHGLHRLPRPSQPHLHAPRPLG